jgi:hypothetical protein
MVIYWLCYPFTAVKKIPNGLISWIKRLKELFFGSEVFKV